MTPSFNQAQYLERTIRSVLDQDYPDLEYFVMDGGSTDGSVDIIQRYAGRLTAWTSQSDGGQAAAIRAAWGRSTGSVLAWLNSDDFYLPGALAQAAHEFLGNPDIELFYGQCDLVDANGRSLGRVGRPFSRRLMLFSHDVIPQPATFLSMAAVQAVGGIDPALHFAMDFDLFMRLAERRAPHYMPQALAGATVHEASKTITGVSGMAAERQMIRRRHARGIERVVVAAQRPASDLFRRLPAPVRHATSLFRPRRIFDPGDE